CGARITYANLIPNSKINITVEYPDYYDHKGVSAIGHFSLHVDNKEGHGGWNHLIDEPIWINGCCSDCYMPLEYNFQWDIDMPTPPKGTWFEVYISIYWHCFHDGMGLTRARTCNSEDVHYQAQV
ncbi:37594_t:CDS:1, partial [Gigaspora margarita]